MSDFVLIAGAWHGGWAWQKVIEILEANGHRAVAPDYQGVGSGSAHDTDLSSHVADILLAIDRAGIDRPLLVGHSLGATIALAVADRLGNAGQLICIDGVVLEAGKSLWDEYPQQARDWLETNCREGRLPPPPPEAFGVQPEQEESHALLARKLAPHPVAAFKQEFWLDHRQYRFDGSYLLCALEGEEINPITMCSSERCAAMGLEVLRIEAGHDPMITDAQMIADHLLMRSS